MGLFSRFRRGRSRTAGGSGSPSKAAQQATLDHLAGFVRTRVGVEAYIEPATHVTQTTMVLIATTGEWTRRRVPNPAAAREVAQELGIPVYDVQLTGYPQRMRDWNAQRRAERARRTTG